MVSGHTAAGAAMHGWRIHDISPDVEAHLVKKMPALSPVLDVRVETLWRKAQAVTPGLFNGRVFSADLVAPNRIEGHWTEYRRIIAQMRDPGLQAALRVRPLATCGVLICRDGVVFGRRPADAAYQPGLWQLPPAGSVDDGAVDGGRADLRGQLLRELSEELGLGPEGILAMTPLCAVEHPGSRVLDLGFAIRTALIGAEVQAAHAAARDAEYPELRVVPFAGLAAALREMGDSVVPPARVFLERSGLLPSD